MALPVFAFGTVSPTKAMVSAIMMAAPRPCAARAAISSQSVGATPHSDRGHREQEDSGQQQPPAADDVAEPSDADDQRGDGEEIGEHDPLDVLEGGVERLRQRRQADIGDAGAERGQQHGERKAGERPANRRCPFRDFRRLPRSRPAMIGFNMNSVFWRLPKWSCQKRSPLPDMAEGAPFALYSCV